MSTVPIGYLVTVTIVAWCTMLALLPLRRPFALGAISFVFGFVLNELQFVAFYWLLASTWLGVDEGRVDSGVGWVALGLAVLTTLGLAVVVWRGLRAGSAVDDALSAGLGAGWRTPVEPGMIARLRHRLPFARILFAPFFQRRRDVERLANIRYGPEGRKNLLDVYRHRSHPSDAPVLVHLHGGALFMGRKNREALRLLYRLASQGWGVHKRELQVASVREIS
jgi:hypothetical protein